MSAGYRVRCTCWWLDVSGIDQAPHSAYIRSFSEPDCPAHPTVDLEPAAPYRASDVQASLERVERRRWRWSYFWLAVAIVNAVVAGWGVRDGNARLVAGGVLSAAGAAFLASYHRDA